MKNSTTAQRIPNTSLYRNRFRRLCPQIQTIWWWCKSLVTSKGLVKGFKERKKRGSQPVSEIFHQILCQTNTEQHFSSQLYSHAWVSVHFWGFHKAVYLCIFSHVWLMLDLELWTKAICNFHCSMNYISMCYWSV